MRKIILIALILSISSSIDGQVFELALTKSINDTSYFPVTYITRANRSNFRSDSTIELSNGETISRYNLYNKCVQRKEQANKYDSIFFLVGTNNGNIIMMVDNNHNHSFKDDIVYTKAPDIHLKTDKEFRNNLPLVTIDSVRYITNKHEIRYEQLQLKFSPVPSQGFSYFEDTSRLNKAKYFNLCIYVTNIYKSQKFIYNRVAYYLVVTIDPLTFPVYPIINSVYSRSAISLYKSFNDTIKFCGSFPIEYAAHQKRNLLYDSASIIVKNVDWENAKMVIEIDSIQRTEYNAKDIDKLRMVSLNNLKKTGLNYKDKEYTLIEFSGSWCKPCVGILPDLKLLNSKLKRDIQLVTINKETNIGIAKSFHKSTKATWSVFFEELNCELPSCSNIIFDVGIYPTLILIDKHLNILFRTNGSNAIDGLKKKLQSMNLLKN